MPYGVEAFAQGLHRHRLPAFEQQFAQTPFDGRHIAPLPSPTAAGSAGIGLRHDCSSVSQWLVVAALMNGAWKSAVWCRTS